LHSTGKDRDVPEDALDFEIARWAQDALARYGVD